MSYLDIDAGRDWDKELETIIEDQSEVTFHLLLDDGETTALSCSV